MEIVAWVISALLSQQRFSNLSFYFNPFFINCIW